MNGYPVVEVGKDQIILPPDIHEMIKRKSSRDPSSRFANKLHILLKFAGSDPKMIEYIGAGWISDTQFRINKKRLGAVMEIKLNTLNVNLRDLGFQQLQQDKNGWTEWTREKFTITSTLSDLADITSDKNGQKDVAKQLKSSNIDDSQSSKFVILRDVMISKCDPEIQQQFRRFTVSIWDELIEASGGKTTFTLDDFIFLAARRFRISKQSLKNATQLIRVIFLCADTTQVTLSDFTKFMAKFGPEETLMEKVGGMLSSSNHHGNWLNVTTDPSGLSNPDGLYGYFDNTEQNCIIFVYQNIFTFKVWNRVNVASSDGKYLVDQNDNEYDSWEQFFQINPMKIQEPSLNPLGVFW
ncbi:39 kDa initiator binding protein, putative [Trichomonas vaginalis G3]|uniref:39 kDa initiator binding protein, putative n=1 Tax=Trichomonas vaginalis (strain ATCC PRA-98 / G3) TaxID=412133 RepID=A2DI90_TRIV3|nr:Initiator binding protein 39 kDa family [Trichomonas vaginalis G3]EAY19886.1 39 kDa initiator binding protein, putative [Trichomonas vaginalis G3]KAI5509987.1 Initiator binding protein 39 kDa family [Trichomonas vaginalis G3]|eukprot:XP_001580872.1 39 kDa initiator binding protein [Trichomonas vaginalis G3]